MVIRKLTTYLVEGTYYKPVGDKVNGAQRYDLDNFFVNVVAFSIDDAIGKVVRFYGSRLKEITSFKKLDTETIVQLFEPGDATEEA